MSHTKQTVMDQAQVYASAWSMVGGPFDRGQALENAEEMSRELSTMIEAVFQQRDELLARLDVVCEVQIVSAAYERIRAQKVFAIDDIEYDLFAAGWKEAISTAKVCAA